MWASKSHRCANARRQSATRIRAVHEQLGARISAPVPLQGVVALERPSAPGQGAHEPTAIGGLRSRHHRVAWYLVRDDVCEVVLVTKTILARTAVVGPTTSSTPPAPPTTSTTRFTSLDGVESGARGGPGHPGHSGPAESPGPPDNQAPGQTAGPPRAPKGAANDGGGSHHGGPCPAPPHGAKGHGL